jgi:hypothetical protein
MCGSFKRYFFRVFTEHFICASADSCHFSGKEPTPFHFEHLKEEARFRLMKRASSLCGVGRI